MQYQVMGPDIKAYTGEAYARPVLLSTNYSLLLIRKTSIFKTKKLNETHSYTQISRDPHIATSTNTNYVGLMMDNESVDQKCQYSLSSIHQEQKSC